MYGLMATSTGGVAGTSGGKAGGVWAGRVITGMKVTGGKHPGDGGGTGAIGEDDELGVN